MKLDPGWLSEPESEDQSAFSGVRRQGRQPRVWRCLAWIKGGGRGE